MTDQEWQAVDSLAKDEWESFAKRIKAECEHMAHTASLDLRYEETSQTSRSSKVRK